MPSRTGARSLPVLALALVLATGCGGEPAPEADPAAGASVAPAPVSVEEQVATVGLRSSDLRGRAVVKPAPGGFEVKGQVTLDQCGYTFTTERLRTARRQVQVVDGDQPGLFSSEVVAYRDEAAATKAMTQLREALAQCDPAKPVKAAMLVGKWRYEILRSDEGRAELPVAGSLRVLQRLTGEDGTRFHVLMVLQQSGALLDGSYLLTDGVPTAEQATELTRQAILTGERLLRVTGASPAAPA